MDNKQPIQLPITAFNTDELRIIFEVFGNPAVVFPAAKGNAANGVLNKVANTLGEKIGEASQDG